MMKSVPLVVLGCFLLHLLCGCGRTIPPTVGLVSMRFETATALETTIVFTVRLSNENPEPVALAGQVHRFHLNGLYVGKGMSDAAVEIPRFDSVTHEVVMRLDNLALATRLKAIIEEQGVDYRLDSVLHGTSWFSRMRTVSEGKLALQDILPAFPGQAATTADDAEASVTVQDAP